MLFRMCRLVALAITAFISACSGGAGEVPATDVRYQPGGETPSISVAEALDALGESRATMQLQIEAMEQQSAKFSELDQALASLTDSVSALEQRIAVAEGALQALDARQIDATVVGAGTWETVGAALEDLAQDSHQLEVAIQSAIEARNELESEVSSALAELTDQIGAIADTLSGPANCPDGMTPLDDMGCMENSSTSPNTAYFSEESRTCRRFRL